MNQCLDDGELLALIEHRMTRTARELAFVHIDACLACLQLLAAIVVSFDARAKEPLQRELELRLDQR